MPCLENRSPCLFPSLTSLPSSPAAIPSFIFRFPHLILPVTFYQLQEEGPMLHGLRCSKLCRFSQVDWQVDVESNCSMWFPKSPEARRFAWWAVPVVVIQKKPRTGSSKLLLHWLQIQSATERERQKETERDASLICNWNPWRLLERFWLTSSKLEKLVCWTVKLPTRIDLFHVFSDGKFPKMRHHTEREWKWLIWALFTYGLGTSRKCLVWESHWFHQVWMIWGSDFWLKPQVESWNRPLRNYWSYTAPNTCHQRAGPWSKQYEGWSNHQQRHSKQIGYEVWERHWVGIPKISGCSLDILWSSLVMNRLQMSNPQIPIHRIYQRMENSNLPWNSYKSHDSASTWWGLLHEIPPVAVAWAFCCGPLWRLGIAAPNPRLASKTIPGQAGARIHPKYSESSFWKTTDVIKCHLIQWISLMNQSNVFKCHM